MEKEKGIILRAPDRDGLDTNAIEEVVDWINSHPVKFHARIIKFIVAENFEYLRENIEYKRKDLAEMVDADTDCRRKLNEILK